MTDLFEATYNCLTILFVLSLSLSPSVFLFLSPLHFNALNFSIYKTNNVLISLEGILTFTDENEGSGAFPVTEMRIGVCIKGLCHDRAHVWALTVADCFLNQSEASNMHPRKFT